MGRATGIRANRRDVSVLVGNAARSVELEVRLELLESRQLLSAALFQINPSVAVKHASAGSTYSASTDGYSPSQIRTAYGFNNINFGGVAGDGSGQTIAIVDAYNDPNIKADLAVFDSQFGIAAPPSFSVVSQTGSNKLPSSDAGWAQETSLDVEWAHAIAPGANILLVESKDDSLPDLVKGVNYARSVAGVSVVSMSWGSSEFSGQTSYDKFFTTPTGHAGVTFVAAAGDDGAEGGAEWPASSPNVISVGGTTLNLTSSGAITSETVWSDTAGGTSTIERVPGYQSSLGVSGRTTADVAYDADPDTGFATYDSLSYEGESGWSETGGTSAGTPQWAALIAIGDQGRATKGYASLDGATGTLPAIYNVYANASSYAADFNDITSGSNASSDGGGGDFGGRGHGGGSGSGNGGGYGGGGGWHHHRGGFGGFPFEQQPDALHASNAATTSTVSMNSAAVGYDVPTGVGTPKAAGFIASLLSAGIAHSSKAKAAVKAEHSIKLHPDDRTDAPATQQILAPIVVNSALSSKLQPVTSAPAAIIVLPENAVAASVSRSSADVAANRTAIRTPDQSMVGFLADSGIRTAARSDSAFRKSDDDGCC